MLSINDSKLQQSSVPQIGKISLLKKLRGIKVQCILILVKAESIASMYVYKRIKKLAYMSFNFIKHLPIQNLFNDKIFLIYSIIFSVQS